jgi:YfiH family protein
MHRGLVKVNSWREYAWLRAGFSTRGGGGSTAYSSDGVGEQNLGWTAEDRPENVMENRRQFLGIVAESKEDELITVRQVHGAVVWVVERGKHALVTDEGKAILDGDGLLTREAGLMLGIQTADCVPVLIADTRVRVVAALHAGWRGTLAGIAGAAVGRMVEEFGSKPGDLIAAIGPAIGPCCFEVGAEVREAFLGRSRRAENLFTKEAEGKFQMDLWEANRRQLIEAGVGAAATTVVGECTVCSRVAGRRKYFSYRAERGRTGRMLSVIGLVEGQR